MAYELEIEELRQLQEIIGRHEDQAFKVRGWMYAVLTVLAAALFTKENPLSSWSYLSISLIVTLMFLCIELVHRGFVRLAINRSTDVQRLLRDKKEYDGPLVSDSLAADLLFKSMAREFLIPSVWIHYIALWLVVVFISCAGR